MRSLLLLPLLLTSCAAFAEPRWPIRGQPAIAAPLPLMPRDGVGRPRGISRTPPDAATQLLTALDDAAAALDGNHTVNVTSAEGGAGECPSLTNCTLLSAVALANELTGKILVTFADGLPPINLTDTAVIASDILFYGAKRSPTIIFRDSFGEAPLFATVSPGTDLDVQFIGVFLGPTMQAGSAMRMESCSSCSLAMLNTTVVGIAADAAVVVSDSPNVTVALKSVRFSQNSAVRELVLVERSDDAHIAVVGSVFNGVAASSSIIVTNGIRLERNVGMHFSMTSVAMRNFRDAVSAVDLVGLRVLVRDSLFELNTGHDFLFLSVADSEFFSFKTAFISDGELNQRAFDGDGVSGSKITFLECTFESYGLDIGLQNGESDILSVVASKSDFARAGISFLANPMSELFVDASAYTGFSQGIDLLGSSELKVTLSNSKFTTSTNTSTFVFRLSASEDPEVSVSGCVMKARRNLDLSGAPTLPLGELDLSVRRSILEANETQPNIAVRTFNEDPMLAVVRVFRSCFNSDIEVNDSARVVTRFNNLLGEACNTFNSPRTGGGTPRRTAAVAAP